MILNLQHLTDKEEDPEDTPRSSFDVELTTNIQLDITYLTSFDTDVHVMEVSANTREGSSLDNDMKTGIKRRAR
jgi:hypothetical protein